MGGFMRIAHVWMEHARLNQTFTYDCGSFDVQAGMRVSVGFGNQTLVAFVDHVEDIPDRFAYEQECGYQLKSILDVIDVEPIFNSELMDLGKWMAYQTLSTVISCYQAMLPNKLKPKSSSGNIKKDIFVHFVKDVEGLTKKQIELLDMCRNGDVLRKDMRSVSISAFKNLLLSGAICLVEKEVEAKVGVFEQLEKPLALTAYQQKTFDEVCASDAICLLHGITGSGKTEIYLQLADKVIRNHEQVLILVPEISLTPQMVKRVQRRFGHQVAIYHSGLNDQKKYEQYQRVRKNEVSIVVGTRSSIFMPFSNLGLIIVDEEHDASYKQDSVPRYHCRDIAIERAKYHGAKLVLGSATPSLESYARALKGVYHLVSLTRRVYGDLPTCEIVDMSKEMRKGNDIISSTLYQSLKECLANGKQAILLLNRRGYTPILRCTECAHVMKCPHCDVALSYHKDDHVLKCHICGESFSANPICPSCHSKSWRFLGVGTQRLEEEVQRLFPQARILRMDADVSRKKGAHEKVLSAFERQEADILVGTQMISKGLDYPNVTLVGILQADALLSHSDYRCVEITFDYLVQASGRSGRGTDEGKVILQAYDASHYVMHTASKQDYVAFFRQEMQYRHLGQYPPYSYFVSIVVSSLDQNVVSQEAFEIKSWFVDKGISVLGPSELLKKQDLYRYRVLLRSKNLEETRQWVHMWYASYQNRKVKVAIDVNPLFLD